MEQPFRFVPDLMYVSQSLAKLMATKFRDWKNNYLEQWSNISIYKTRQIQIKEATNEQKFELENKWRCGADVFFFLKRKSEQFSIQSVWHFNYKARERYSFVTATCCHFDS